MEFASSNASFGGTQHVVTHRSEVLDCTMRVAIYLPPGAERGDLPVLYFLSGLTCTEQNATNKAGLQRAAAEHGVILVLPDTSPRGEDVADDEGWDLGKGAGFYLTATQAPWSSHYRMDAYVIVELPKLVAAFTSSAVRSVMGHSMGGLGALNLALRHPGHFVSVSAFAPILTPSAVPWGKKAFAAYLGDDRSTWQQWDPTQLIQRATERLPMLIDQGDSDTFLAAQLPSEAFLTAAQTANYPVTYRLQPGYDHSYYFVASFVPDHVAFHANATR